MRKFIVAALLGLSLIFVLGASCYKSNSSSAPVATTSVTIQNFAFNPQTITVSVGSVVTWTNQDSAQHQIVSDGNLSELSSGLIDQNGTYSFTFSNAGTYDYHCNIHPSMKGKVIVK